MKIDPPLINVFEKYQTTGSGQLALLSIQIRKQDENRYPGSVVELSPNDVTCTFSSALS